MNRSALDGVHVLVVDDDAAVRGLYVTFLRQAGATVTSSRAASEAVQLVDLQRPDVVVTDLQMPGRDGVWLLQELNARRPGLPVIVVSGNIDDAARERLLALGFADIMYKPLRLSQFVATIAAVVRRRGRET